MKAIIDNTISGLITINDRGVVETTNPSARKLFNYEPEEIVGHNIPILMPQPIRSPCGEYIHIVTNALGMHTL